MQARALDVGCAVGGSCFELARQCPEVLGLEQSAHLVEAANSLRASGSMQVFRQVPHPAGPRISPRPARTCKGVCVACSLCAAGMGLDLRNELRNLAVRLDLWTVQVWSPAHV